MAARHRPHLINMSQTAGASTSVPASTGQTRAALAPASRTDIVATVTLAQLYKATVERAAGQLVVKQNARKMVIRFSVLGLDGVPPPTLNDDMIIKVCTDALWNLGGLGGVVPEVEPKFTWARLANRIRMVGFPSQRGTRKEILDAASGLQRNIKEWDEFTPFKVVLSRVIRSILDNASELTPAGLSMLQRILYEIGVTYRHGSMVEISAKLNREIFAVISDFSTNSVILEQILKASIWKKGFHNHSLLVRQEDDAHSLVGSDPALGVLLGDVADTAFQALAISFPDCDTMLIRALCDGYTEMCVQNGAETVQSGSAWVIDQVRAYLEELAGLRAREQSLSDQIQNLRVTTNTELGVLRIANEQLQAEVATLTQRVASLTGELALASVPTGIFARFYRKFAAISSALRGWLWASQT